ncbi:MAG: hypothetical protein AAGJ40_00195 [Planctomycetota bacterium]
MNGLPSSIWIPILAWAGTTVGVACAQESLSTSLKFESASQSIYASTDAAPDLTHSVPDLTTVNLGIPEIPVERFRKSFFQGGELLGGFVGDGSDVAVGRDSDGGLSETFWETRLSFGIPLGSLDNILAIRPFFRADHLNGPEGIDVPATLYSTGVTLLQRKEWNEKLSTIAILTPSVRSDFTTSENAVRWFGLGLIQWKCRDDLSLSIGAVYLDRSDLSVLPAAGLTWTPRPWWKIDLMLPRPMIKRRLWKQGGQAEGWVFAGGSIGGNTWAVTRRTDDARDGDHDELTISGLRLFGGYETIASGNRGWRVESGLVFDRSIEYEGQSDEFGLANAWFVEASWLF